MLASIDLSNLSSLQTVALYDNQLTSVTLLNLPLLSYLYLAGNMLTDEGFDFVPANQHMQDIYLNNNNFNSFPSSLLSLDSLN
jgi:Leucine-rich repeat (LRR) protein